VCAECPRRLADDLDRAFPEFLAHHQDLVYGIALRSTKRPADAEELAQDAFVRAYRALVGYDTQRIRELRPKGWLAAIANNLARNRARRRLPSTADLEGLAEIRADEAPGPESMAERREAAAVWHDRLARLPARYQRAVELRHVSGLSYPELAEALDRPVGTVKSDVHRGVRLLREALAEEARHDDERRSHEVA
jgi:RNA polymerase sigma factor (sigma-70 family)